MTINEEIEQEEIKGGEHKNINLFIETSELDINDIVLVSFKLNKPIFYDAFKNHRTNFQIEATCRTKHSNGIGHVGLLICIASGFFYERVKAL